MEHKSVIVRTRKGNTVECFLFMTPNYNQGNVLPTFVSPKKIADKIELCHFVGGMLAVTLTSEKSNGNGKYNVVENVYFEKDLVTAIEVFTEYDTCRNIKVHYKNCVGCETERTKNEDKTPFDCNSFIAK